MSETEIQRLNPKVVEKIKDAAGWTSLFAGSLNLTVDLESFEELINENHVLRIDWTEIKYPPGKYEHIPQTRNGYRYYPATIVVEDRSADVLVRRAERRGPLTIEVYAESNLRQMLSLSDGDVVTVRVGTSAP